jgi:hypothetical protein
MRYSRAAVALAAALLVACGSGGSAVGEAEFADTSSNPALASLPANVEGTLDMSLGEGNDEEDGADMLFGSLVVGREDLYIQVDSRLLDTAGIPPEGARVRATIGSKEDLGSNMTQYTITALEKL